jgi:hypothetical protein
MRNRFLAFAFECSLYRCTEAEAALNGELDEEEEGAEEEEEDEDAIGAGAAVARAAVGLCRLNQVDP